MKPLRLINNSILGLSVATIISLSLYVEKDLFQLHKDREDLERLVKQNFDLQADFNLRIEDQLTRTNRNFLTVRGIKSNPIHIDPIRKLTKE